MKKFLPRSLAAAAILAAAPHAAAQVSNPSITVSTNFPAWPAGTFTNGQPSIYSFNAQTTNCLPLYVNSGLAVQGIYSAPQGGGFVNSNLTGAVLICFFPSVDGTNAILTGGANGWWAQLVAPPNGTNAVIFGTNWSQLQLNGFKAMFYTVSNNCSDRVIFGGAITNVLYGVTNIYPAGLTFSRPLR